MLDLDGTLANSLHVLRECYQKCALSFGRTPRDEEFDAINGPPLAQIARLLSRNWNLEADGMELLHTYDTLIDEAYARVDPAEGAFEVLALARRRGWTTGVVTSNSRRRTTDWLTRVRLAPMIEVVVTHEDVPAGKPAPDAYAHALRLGGAAADASLAVEDSPQGVVAARAAQLRTLAIDPGRRGEWPVGVDVLRRLADVASFL